jgi:hypothetical protein
MNSILRLIVWAWSIGWLGWGASAFSNGDAVRSCLSACCLAVGIGADELLGRRAEANRAQRAHRSTEWRGGSFRD